MLQVDHIYEFLYQELFKDFEFWHFYNGVIEPDHASLSDISIFNPGLSTTSKIFFYDQEPFIPRLSKPYMDIFNWVDNYTVDELVSLNASNNLPYNMYSLSPEEINFLMANPQSIYKKKILVTSEISPDVIKDSSENNYHNLYYFFHGFAALDWYRGYHALNYNKPIVKPYKYDFISFNRIIVNDRSYRIYFVSLLKELGLLESGLVSFNVTDNLFDEWQDETADPNTRLSEKAKYHIEQNLTEVNKLIIDHPHIHGSASANIPRTVSGQWVNNDMISVDAFWHVVTETVFYYDKLHLTEKIFKPIVSKQPFMLLAAPGNLAYLKRYGFKTFDLVIDESYDLIQDNDLRTEAVIKQLHWYCNLTTGEKTDIIQQLEPIIDYNFHHFYGEFRHIIARELIDNTKTLFKEIGYDDTHIAYPDIYKILVY